eukprot:1148257-Pelagomonas_calceolata.AAC.6
MGKGLGSSGRGVAGGEVAHGRGRKIQACRRMANSAPDPHLLVPVTLHTILLGVGGVIYTPHTPKPLKKLGLDTHKIIGSSALVGVGV